MSKRNRNRRKRRPPQQAPVVVEKVNETEETTEHKVIVDKKPEPPKAMAMQEKPAAPSMMSALIPETPAIIKPPSRFIYDLHIISPIEGKLFVCERKGIESAKEVIENLRGKLIYPYAVRITNKNTQRWQDFSCYRPLREYVPVLDAAGNVARLDIVDNQPLAIEACGPFVRAKWLRRLETERRALLKSPSYQAEQKLARLRREGVPPPTRIEMTGAYLHGMTLEAENEIRKWAKRTKHQVHQGKRKAVGKFIRTQRAVFGGFQAGINHVAAGAPQPVAVFKPSSPSLVETPSWASAMRSAPTAKPNGHAADPEARLEPHMIPVNKEGVEEIPGLPRVSYGSKTIH